MPEIDRALPNVRVLTHSAIRICGEGGAPVVYFDPYDLAAAGAGSPHDADCVLVTHAHFDHLSPKDLARVAGEKTVLVVPESVAAEASGLPVAEVRPLHPGERLELPGLLVEAVCAYNVEPERLGFHPRENGWLGYVVTLDGVRYYVAGDTDQNPDNEAVGCDVALVPVGGTYTMDAAQAAAFVNALRPQAAVPTHYGTVAGTPADGAAFAAAVDPGVTVVLKLG